ncbi:hypothetical protein NPX13_g10294 [Xylaria arbuscula]|uniref:Uncharacterized protein n=1 Tax=Xylaria arbuscula TaxID=114810 RepID=A0A9W8THM2_9PEZI|nr:hypothetical protein NPX13_g10294 [Xylaria arbuscula]
MQPCYTPTPTGAVEAWAVGESPRVATKDTEPPEMAAEKDTGTVAAPLMAATLAGGALFPAVALAEAPPQQAQDYHLLRKKPIYDDFEERPLPKSTTPVPSPTSDTIPPSSKPLPGPVEDEHQIVVSRGPTPTDRLAEQIGRARPSTWKSLSPRPLRLWRRRARAASS